MTHLFRKCRCGPVWPLELPLHKTPKCKTCKDGYRYEPEYDDYVKLHESRARIVRVIREHGDKELLDRIYEAW